MLPQPQQGQPVLPWATAVTGAINSGDPHALAAPRRLSEPSMEAKIRDRSTPIYDGVAGDRLPTLTIDLYDEAKYEAGKYPTRVLNTTFDGVKAYPSAVSMQRITSPTKAGSYARTDPSLYGKVFATELFGPGDRIRVYQADNVFVWDVPFQLRLPAKVKSSGFDGTYLLTAQYIDPNGAWTDLAAGALGDLAAQETNGLATLAKDTKVWWMPDTGRADVAGGRPYFVAMSVRTFLARITSQSVIDADKQWTYGVEEVYPQTNPYAAASGGSFTAVSGGRSGTAYNGIEAGNSATVHGNGTTYANLLGTFKVQPIKVGDIVEVTETIDADNNNKYIISKMNGNDGGCA